MTDQIGVVGAGTMGVGVSLAFARAGHDVVLLDNRTEALPVARRRLAADAHHTTLLDRSAGNSPVIADPETVVNRIVLTTEPADLGEVGYVVENISENWPAKRALYRVLDEVCKPECVLAVNTSAIPITKVAGQTGRADRVLGNHFMNPAHLMPLVEVIPGVHTSADTLAASRKLLSGIGKRSVVVNDSPGFVTNRVLMLTINEAIFLLHEGVSDARDVDRLFRQCFGHRMGPLETADLIGLDTILYSLEVLLEEFQDPKYRPCPLLRRHVDAGWLGRKSGRGFHQYEEIAA